MNKPFHTPTEIIIRKMLTHSNPVTRAVYRQILGNRIDRANEINSRKPVKEN